MIFEKCPSIKSEQLPPSYPSFPVLAEFINDPIYVIDSVGNVVYANQAWYKFNQLDKDADVIGRHILSVLEQTFPSYWIFDNHEHRPFSLYNLDDPGVSASSPSLKKRPVPAALLALESKKAVSIFGYTNMETGHYIHSLPIFNEQDEIIHVITRIQELDLAQDLIERFRNYISDSVTLSEELSTYYKMIHTESKLLGKSQKITELRSLIHVASKTDATILITGENGVGKEVVAKEIYANSPRNESPFITVNCAAIPENLIESELFGYEKGAFTGAVSGKPGMFELAHKGTILLDEVGDIPLLLQPKLLRVIQEKEMLRVGGVKKISVDVRIIASTNKNLYAMTQNGTFRQDLYYRLNVINMKIPPLRERREDIPLLASGFLNYFNEKYAKSKIFTDRTFKSLIRYNWPGNVRELENIIERCVIIGENNYIDVNDTAQLHDGGELDFPNDFQVESSLEEMTKAYEKKILEEALFRYKSTRTVAKLLKTSQPTIVRKAQALGISGWNSNKEQ